AGRRLPEAGRLRGRAVTEKKGATGKRGTSKSEKDGPTSQGRRKNVRAPKPRAALDYAASGVDIDAADDAKHRIKRLVEGTYNKNGVGKFGGFGGMFRLPSDAKNAVL